MATVTRWRFQDPSMDSLTLDPADEWQRDWTVPQNPAEMTSPWPEKTLTVHATAAVDGQALLYEGQSPPQEWQFSGSILNHEHHARLLYWSEKRVRTIITDHFGRDLVVYLSKFDPVPQRGGNRYWRHDYTMHAYVLKKPTAPTVGV